MLATREPRYTTGQRVICQTDLHNDGTHPERGADALLAAAGTVGEVVNVGHHQESNTPVYLVEFPGLMLVGCLEEEIEAC